MTLRIDTPSFLIAIDIIAGLLALYLLVRSTWSRTLVGVLAFAGGALLGWFLVWLTDNVFNAFGVGVTPTTTMWVALGVGGVALAVATFFRARWWRTAVAIASIPVFVIAAFAGVNVDFGAYRDLSDAVGVVPYGALDLHHEYGEVVAGTSWSAATTQTALPAKGEVGTVRIPATVSRFPAREAVVYLPPAAIGANPPPLPVLYALSGQPGSPADMFTAGRIAAAMNAYAAAHDGRAPIVVAPDQLGGPDRNPMCVDSRAYGDSATYLLEDVRTWITSHVRVSSDPAGWGVFGYSQGATCAVQFATGHPELFGSALASSSELGPRLGDKALTIETGFDGSAAAYAAAQPSAVMKAHTPYRDSLIVFGVGQNDSAYTAFAKELYADACAAGIRSELLISPGTAHDWNTVHYTLEKGFPMVAAHMGLP